MTPNAYHFVSYSSVDGRDFALKLADCMQAGPPSIKLWVDQREIHAGEHWDSAVARGLEHCETVLFVMTPDSVEDNSGCLDECSKALSYKKPIIPLLLKRGLIVPLLVERRQRIDFTGPFDSAVAALRDQLRWLNSDEGRLRRLQDRLADAKRDLRRATEEPERDRILQDISRLQADIDRQKDVIADPRAAIDRTQASIVQGVELERNPNAPPPETAVRTINPAPTTPPSHFQDRHVETGLLGDFLKDEALRIAVVVGRGGTGKTAMVCRLLKALEKGELPDDRGPWTIDSIVYLSAVGVHRITAENIVLDLLKLLPDREVEKVHALFRQPQVSITAQIETLLAGFRDRRTVLVLDNFETLVDTAYQITDHAVAEALKAFLNAPPHGVKVIITSRITPRDLALEQPGRQIPVPLDDGLPSPYAENLLRAMDVTGAFGLKTASDSLLEEARVRTRGYPRALEALFAILAADRSASLADILSSASGVLPQNVVQVLVGEAFSRLDALARQVMQGLAIYNHPVPAGAVDYLLQPGHPSIESAPVLDHLVNMQFARKDSGRYYLHPVDREYAFRLVPKGEPADRQKDPPVFTRYALLDRAAAFYQQARRPIEECGTLSDLIPQQMEFYLRCEGEDYDAALSVLAAVSSLLELWGHFRLLAEHHVKLLGKLSSPDAESWNRGQYGWILDRLGNMDAAVACYLEALDLARKSGSIENEVNALTKVGGAYADLGRVAESEDCLHKALSLARTKSDEHTCFCLLAYLYMQLGQNRLALSYLDQALTYSQESPTLLPSVLCNRACAFGKLGEFDSALNAAKDGVVKARRNKDRMGECGCLAYCGIVLIDQNRLDEAKEHLVKAIEIADDVANLQFQNEARLALALAHLYAGNLAEARTFGEAALRYEARQLNNPLSGLHAFLGIVSLRQRDQPAATGYFQSAIAKADEILAGTPTHCAVLEPKALALCGLALCLDPAYANVAAETYRSVRALTTDRGIVLRSLRLFDAIAEADPNGILSHLRSDVAPAGILDGLPSNIKIGTSARSR